ncbi:MAG: tetratricopeptide repeat protein, partial [Planctomycetota bacterium]|nr:tetratricopeptide repeat protein [Planctomycetota bacterium]
GGTKGFASVLARFLDHDHLVVILGNVRQIPQNTLGNDLWNTVLGFKVRPLSNLYNLAMSEGAEAAAQAYRARQNRGSEDELPKEADINRAGYLFLSLGRTADAIAVLGLNIALHPESANAHDSLGEAYLKTGDVEKAIANYEKSLELNPQNANARRVLERIRSD